MTRAVRLWIATVTLSVFGPYVTGQVRTEQVAVILSFLVVVTFGARRFLAHQSLPALTTIYLWLALLAVIAVATLATPADYGAYSPKSVVGGIAAFTLPLALLGITSYWNCLAAAREVLRTVAMVVVTAMSVNAIFSLYCLYRGSILVLGFLPHFWTSRVDGTSSVASLAFQNGRYTGIFNQPAEAGAAYGIALFCIVYLVQIQPRSHTPRLVLLATLITLGGTLSVSKVFLLGALPIVLLLLVRDRPRRARVIGGIAVLTIAGYGLQRLALLPVWSSGVDMLRQLGNPERGLLSTFSGGRYGGSSGGSLNPVTAYVLHLRPLVGLGAGGLNAPYDSLWVETLVFGGAIGLALLVAVCGVLLWRWTRVRSAIGQAEARLTGATLALAIGGAFGIPTLTGNRITTLFWLVLGTMLAYEHGSTRRTGPQEEHHHRRAAD